MFRVGVMSTVTFVGLSILQLPFALLLALMTGVLEVIPIVGPITAGAIACLVALGHPAPWGLSQIWYVAIVAAVYTVLRHSEDYFVIPLVVGRIVKLHPAVVIFSLLNRCAAHRRGRRSSVATDIGGCLVVDRGRRARGSVVGFPRWSRLGPDLRRAPGRVRARVTTARGRGGPSRRRSRTSHADPPRGGSCRPGRVGSGPHLRRHPRGHRGGHLLSTARSGDGGGECPLHRAAGARDISRCATAPPRHREAGGVRSLVRQPSRAFVSVRRFIAFGVAIVVIFSTLTARLYDLEIVRGDYYHQLSEQNRLVRLPVPAERGGIVDRNGYVLARNIPGFAISVPPPPLPPTRDDAPSHPLPSLLDLPSDAIADIIRAQRIRNPYEPVRTSQA